MKEDIHIKIAARLADTDAPERLSHRRANHFVAKTIGKKKTISFAVWGGSAMAVAASIVFAIVLFSPGNSKTFGTPNRLQEMQSVHSEISVVDTTVVDSLETSIIIKSIEE